MWTRGSVYVMWFGKTLDRKYVKNVKELMFKTKLTYIK